VKDNKTKIPPREDNPLDRFVMPSDFVTAEMIGFARTEDVWHFAANLNALMQNGYCRVCGLTPNGCKREGCGA
jgi:hypothetical protein